MDPRESYAPASIAVSSNSFLHSSLLLSRFSRVRLCATPETAAHQAPLSLGFSRLEHWSGLPFPSPMHESEKWKWSHSVVSDPQQPHVLHLLVLLLLLLLLLSPFSRVRHSSLEWSIYSINQTEIPSESFHCISNEIQDFPLATELSRRRQWHPTPVLLPGKSHGWRSLVGYSPWGR